jgi:hypothetical protein
MRDILESLKMGIHYLTNGIQHARLTNSYDENMTFGTLRPYYMVHI